MSAAFADFGKDPTQTGRTHQKAGLSRVLAKISKGRTQGRISRRLIVGIGSSISENEVPVLCGELVPTARRSRVGGVIQSSVFFPLYEIL